MKDSILKMVVVSVFALLVIPGSEAIAAGQYDGIWQISYGGQFQGYVSIHQTGNEVVTIWNEPSGSWEAGAGYINGDYVRVTTIISNADAVMDVNFSSATSFTVTSVSCSPHPGYRCTLPNGAILYGYKIF